MAVEQVRVVSNPNYYYEEQSLTPPTFILNGAKILGIEGQAADQQTFLNLYAGYTTGENGERDIKLPSYMHANRRGALEITVNLPKDPSVINLVAPDRRIDKVFHDSLMAVALDVQEQTVVRKTRKEGVEYHNTNNLICSIYDHCASRAGDPHRHGHLVFQNLSLESASEKWQGVEMGYLDYAQLTRTFNKVMRKGLNELGYKTRAKGTSFEVIGFPWDVKTEFSQRHHGIKEMEADYEAKKGAPLTSKAKSKLSVIDRPEKPDDKPLAERQSGWRARLSASQLAGVNGMVEAAVRRVVEKTRSAVRNSKMRAAAQQYIANFRQPSIIEPKYKERGIER